MNLHDLRPVEGSTSAPKRVGRGTGSGLGKTSAKGHKGQKARSGSKKNGFEARRLPKRGFTNIFAKEYSTVNIEALNCFEDGTVVTAELLKEKRIISKIEKDGLKVLGRGELTKRLDVKAAKFTETAQKAIEAAGGTVEVI